MAQGNIIKLAETEYDFGLIKEETGQVSHIFTYSNTGTDTLKITSVEASCGCTVPEWSKKPLLPGEKGTIKVTFDPTNRPGPFVKTINIVANTTPAVSIITINGSVIPKNRTINEQFPDQQGHLRIASQGVNLGTIKTNKVIQKDVEVYNDGDKPLTFTNHVVAPSHISVSYIPEKIPAKSKGIIRITYDAKKKNDYGFVSDYVEIYTDEADEFKKMISVYATLEEYFPPLTGSELVKAPKIKFNKVEHSFGTVNQGDVVTTSFVVTNIGKNDLYIRKTKVTCSCTSSDVDKKILKPGESTNLNVTFDSAGKEGLQVKSITIFTNDPVTPTVYVGVRASVRK